MTYREPPVSVSTARRQLLEAMARDSVTDIEEAARWLAFYLERDESPDPPDVMGAIDRIAELEREIGQRRQATLTTIVAGCVLVGSVVMLLTKNPPFGICAALLMYLLLDNFVLRKMPSFVGVEMLLRDAAHQRYRFLRRHHRHQVRVAELEQAGEELDATSSENAVSVDEAPR